MEMGEKDGEQDGGGPKRWRKGKGEKEEEERKRRWRRKGGGGRKDGWCLREVGGLFFFFLRARGPPSCGPAPLIF